jgi:hypothetical protein
MQFPSPTSGLEVVKFDAARSEFGNECSHAAAIVSSLTTQPGDLQGHSERMMGLEPTTFCMASASDRSRPFARVRSNGVFAASSPERASAREPERTLNLAILATPAFDSEALPSQVRSAGTLWTH